MAALPLSCDAGRPGRAGAGAVAPAGSVVVTVDATKPRQRLDGFGAATAYYQNWIAAHPNKAALYDALFRGLKLDILRLQNVWRPGKGPDFAKDDLDIVRGAEASLGRPVTLMMSSWSPPAALKSNKSEKNGGTLARDAKGAFAYGGFAGYWHDSLVAYRRAGIDPKYVSIQNEPDWKAEWESCLFEPSEGKKGGAPVAGYDRAVEAVAKTLATLPDPPRLVGPETLGVGYGNPQRYLDPKKDAALLGRLWGVAHHLYSGGTHESPDTFNERLRAIRDDYPDKPRWMTEFGRSDGLQTAWVIHNSLVEEEAGAYVYWAAIWPGDDCLITIDNPWERAKWKHPEGFRLNDRYFALKHYSYLTAPGYRRVEVRTADPAVKASGYLSPGGDWLVVVALNTSDKGEKALWLDLKGFAPGPRPPAAYRSVFPAGGAAAMPEQFKDMGALPADGRIALPPRSAVTVALEGKTTGAP